MTLRSLQRGNTGQARETIKNSYGGLLSTILPISIASNNEAYDTGKREFDGYEKLTIALESQRALRSSGVERRPLVHRY